MTICKNRQHKGLKPHFKDLPGNPVIKILPSNAGGMGLLPGQEAKILYASQPKHQNIKQKQYCNKFNGLHQNKKKIFLNKFWYHFLISTCCSVTKSCLTLCNPVNCSTPGFPVLHYLPQFVRTHIHWVGDAIQPSQPLSLPFPLAFNLSQHQSFPTNWLFASGGQSIEASALASVLSMNILGWCPLQSTGLISMLSKEL